MPDDRFELDWMNVNKVYACRGWRYPQEYDDWISLVTPETSFSYHIMVGLEKSGVLETSIHYRAHKALVEHQNPGIDPGGGGPKPGFYVHADEKIQREHRHADMASDHEWLIESMVLGRDGAGHIPAMYHRIALYAYRLKERNEEGLGAHKEEPHPSCQTIWLSGGPDILAAVGNSFWHGKSTDMKMRIWFQKA